MDRKDSPSVESLNKLLSRCYGETNPSKKFAQALKNSFCNVSIKQQKSQQLFGFVRITTDKGLNANLWDLAAQPGEYQSKFLKILLNTSLGIIRRELPGCSVSLGAPSIALEALQSEGFLLDPNGIRAMAYRIR